MGSIKISKPLGSGQVKSYNREHYAAAGESYYSESGKAQGQWYGVLAEQFGLTGGVTQEALDRLADGQHPVTGEQLVKWKSATVKEKGKPADHRAAFDFTFAPHKSITAAAIPGGDYRLVAAHESSVRVAMKAGEFFTQARISSHLTSNTENLVAAMFTHDVARPVDGIPDPHLHTHVVVFNMTDDNGRIRAVQPEQWYRIQQFLDAVYQCEMAVRIQELGYTLERDLDSRAAIIKGYTKEYLDSISRRTAEIEATKEERGVYGAKANQIIALQTRKNKVDWPAEKVREYHREQALAMGIDPDAIPTAARRAPTKVIEPFEANAALTFAKHSLIDRQGRTAVCHQDELMTEALHYGIGNVRLRDVERAFDKRQEEFIAVDHWRAHTPGLKLTTPAMQAMERESMEVVSDGRGKAAMFMPNLTKDDFREQYTGTLNNAQMRLAYDVLTCKDRVFGIQGGAGVGKTTALSPIRQMIEDQGYEVFGVAPTSRAASELTEAGITNAQTLQRYLLSPKTETAAKPRVLVIDESSLASTAQIHNLLGTLRPQDRAILVGDIRQHQSVEAGRIFEQLQQSGMETFHLNKIMRQKDSPQLLAAVKEFSKGNSNDGLDLLDKAGHLKEFESQHDRYREFTNLYSDSPRNTTGIAPDNKSVTDLNLLVRQKLADDGHVAKESYAADILRNRQDLTAAAKDYAFSHEVGNAIRFSRANKQLGVATGDYGTVKAIDRDANQVTVAVNGKEIKYSPGDVKGTQLFRKEERSFSVGDRIQFTQPWRAKRVDNRDFGHITYLDDAGNVKVKLDKTGERTVAFNLKSMPHLEYGYVVTSYAIQAASRENILVHVAANDIRTRTMVDKIFANVAVSRAKMNCTIVCDSKDELRAAFQKTHLKAKAHSYEQIKSYEQTKEYSVA